MKDERGIFTVWIHLIVVLGTLIGFSLYSWKSAWYPTIYYFSLSTLATVPLYLWFAKYELERGIFRFSVVLATGVAIASASFPSLFRHPRPEQDFIQSKSSLLPQTKAKRVADCVGLDPWQWPFLIRYFWDATLVGCKELADFEILSRTEVATALIPSSRLVKASDHYVLVRRE